MNNNNNNNNIYNGSQQNVVSVRKEPLHSVKKILKLSTPTYTILTNDIAPEFISMDLLRNMEGQFILNCPLNTILKKKEIFEVAKKCFIDSSQSPRDYLNYFCDIKGSYRYMNIRNVLQDNFSISVNETITMNHNKQSVAFSWFDFLNCIKIFQPEIVCIPCELVKPDEKIGKNKKHRITCLMEDHLESIIKLKKKPFPKWLCILSLPIALNDYSYIEEIIYRYDYMLDGYLISGWGYNESAKERTEMFKLIAHLLPKDKLKFMQLNDGNPLEILHCIYNGIDVVEPKYPYMLARNGKAITLKIHMEEDDENDEEEKQTSVYDINSFDYTYNDIFILDLNDRFYKKDHSTLTEDSPRKELRSYIYHLLQCKELTANMILMHHNLYLFHMFFQEIRKQIKNDNLTNYINWFINTNCKEFIYRQRKLQEN